MKYYKIMIDGATLCCIKTDLIIDFDNINSILSDLKFESLESIEIIIELDAEEAYEYYDVIDY